MFRLGIRTRLMYSFFIVTSFSLLLVASYVLWYVYNHDLNGLMATMSVECDIVDELLHDELLDSLKRDNVDSQVKDLGRRVGLRMTVIDRDGTPLADSDADPALMENHSNRPEVLAALSGQKGTAVRFSDTTSENLLYMAIPVYDGNHVIAAIRLATSLTHIEDGFNKIRNAMIAAFLVTFILAIAVSARLARKYTAPLEEIAETSREIANGKLETRVHLKTGDELEILAHAINNLTSHLEDKINETTAEKNKLELILEHMDNGVIMFDKYGKVLSVNKMAAFRFAITTKMIGQHNMNVIGKSVLDQAIQHTLESGENQSMDLSLRVDNVKRVYQVSLAPIRDSDLAIHAVLAVFHDITTLQEMHERQSEFVANASHELATPLTAIKGFTETLLDGAMHDPALSKKFLTIIFNESERMTRLIKDLLQLAKLDSQTGETKPNSDPVSLGPLVQHVVEDLTPYWENKNLTVTIAAENDPLWVKAHPDWVKQILSNLLENAVKYTPEGGKIILSYRAEDQLAVIAVQDTGIGIPAKDLPFIFDRFYRVDRARSRKAGGTGLGLSIVKFIVETLGGRITVTSQPETGSVFTVFLPRSIQ